jgi:hypothetical protein
MELVIGFIVVVALLGIFNLAALRWGYNSRSYTSDWKPRSDFDFYDPKPHLQ